MEKKGQTGGLVTSLVFGIASLVIGVIIAFVIVSTLTGAGLLEDGRTSATTTNETGGHLNETGYTLANFNSATTKAISITAASNATGTPFQPILVGNFTVDQATGIVTNATAQSWLSVNITYSVTTESNEESSSDLMSSNFTKGVNNVSSKIPTVLLIAAIVLILSVLAVLVTVWGRMKLTGGSSL